LLWVPTDDELHELYSSPSIIGITSDEVGGACGSGAKAGEKDHVYDIGGKTGGGEH
jgi:hypothetical protein